MKYLLSIQDPEQTERILNYLETQEKVSVQEIPIYDGETSENERNTISFLSRLYFLTPENQRQIFELIEKLVALEIQEQARFFQETAEEDLEFANMDLENYSYQLKTIDSE